MQMSEMIIVYDGEHKLEIGWIDIRMYEYQNMPNANVNECTNASGILKTLTDIDNRKNKAWTFLCIFVYVRMSICLCLYVHSFMFVPTLVNVCSSL